MSTGIGTLQAPRTNRSIWPAAVIASLVMLSIGIGAFFLGRDSATPTAKSVVGGTEQSVVAGTAANTPTELTGGLAGGFVQPVGGTTAGSSWVGFEMTADMQAAIVAAREAAGNTAASSWIAVGVTPDMQAAIIAAREAADPRSGPSLGTNTPSEVSAGDRARQQI